MEIKQTSQSPVQLPQEKQRIYAEQFYERLKRSRRTFLFEKIKRSGPDSYSASSLWLWLKMDMKYVLLSGKRIYKKWKLTRGVIRKEYGVSGIRQFIRMLYVVFVARNVIKHYYSLLIFKNENWKKRNEFAFQISVLQHDLVEASFPLERGWIEDKLQFYRHCQKYGLPTPEVLASGNSGHFYLLSDNGRSCLNRDLFVKRRRGGQGFDCMVLRYDGEGHRRSGGEKFSSESLDEKLKGHFADLGEFIVQPLLRNHESWRRWTPGSLATCRIVSARDPENEDRIIPLFAAFRMPRQGSDIDNYAQGGVIAPIGIEDGKLGSAVTLFPINGKFEFNSHPNTGARITGERIPRWDELIACTIRVHSHFNHYFVGWDLTLAEEGCMMIEGNLIWASGSYEIPWQDSLKNTVYPFLHEKWLEKHQG